MISFLLFINASDGIMDRELEAWGLESGSTQSGKRESAVCLQQPVMKKQKASKGAKKAAAAMASVIGDKSQTSIGSFFKKKK